MPVRPIRIEGDVAYVPLTKGYEAIIDVADVLLVDAWNWYAMTLRGKVYACRNGSRASGTTEPRAVYMHRVLMGSPEGYEIDHEDGDGTNNRRSNLRVATNEQNQHNQGMRKNNTSGVKGAHFHKQARRWMAQISVKGENQRLGMFGCRTAAQFAYVRKVQELRGEFGRVS